MKLSQKKAESNPYTYEEAMIDIDSHHWVKAMKFELDFMYSNQVRDLIKAPNGIKPIGYKWVYKRRRGIDVKVETKLYFVYVFPTECMCDYIGYACASQLYAYACIKHAHTYVPRNSNLAIRTENKAKREI